MNSNQKIILKALSISEMEYAELIFNSAYEWMRFYFGGEEALIITGLERSAFFWSWWRNQWQNRDCDFIWLTGFDESTTILDEDTIQITRALYQSHNDVYKLEIKPNRFAMKEAIKIFNGLKKELHTKSGKQNK